MRKFILMPAVSGLNFKHPGGLFFNIFMSLPPEVTAFYCDSAFAREHPELMALLEEKKITVQLDSNLGLGPDSLVEVSGLQRFNPSKSYLNLQRSGVKTIFYLAPTEELGYNPGKDEYIFYPSEHQLFFSARGARYSPDAQGDPEVAFSPQGGQGAAIGLYRGESILAGRDDGRSALRGRLAEAAGCRFDDGRPLLYYPENYHFDPEPFTRGLAWLAGKSDIFVKDISFEGHLYQYPMPPLPASDHIFVYGRDQSLNYLARYAADATMTMAFGGGLTSSVMVGARVIPIYTQRIYPFTAQFNQRKMIGFTWHVRAYGTSLPARVMDYLTPLPLEAPELIFERMLDEEYWANYQKILPEIQRYAFGRFVYDEAAFNRARGFVIRFLQGGSLAPADCRDSDLISLPAIPNFISSPPL